jgi:uncharacterized protein (DUF1697 family)
MKIFIALFRGINVGGKSRLPMKDLVEILEGLGCRKVKTYIQSGNAVFQSKNQDATRLAAKIGGEIKKRHGFQPGVFLLELKDFELAIKKNPFPEAVDAPATLHLGFLASKPVKPNLTALENLKKESERFYLREKVFYLHAPEGIGRSKLAASAERLLGVGMTDRNWRTVGKIRSMAQELKLPHENQARTQV